MKAPLDQNLSFRLVDVLLPRFPGSCHVRDGGLTGDDDDRIWALAKTVGFVIVTKDNDFLARALVRGHPPVTCQHRHRKSDLHGGWTDDGAFARVQKKSQRTPPADLMTAKRRLTQLRSE